MAIDGPFTTSSPGSPGRANCPLALTTRVSIPGRSWPALPMVPILCDGGINATEVQVSVRPGARYQKENPPPTITITDHILDPYYSWGVSAWTAEWVQQRRALLHTSKIWCGWDQSSLRRDAVMTDKTSEMNDIIIGSPCRSTPSEAERSYHQRN
jgi:hypothetical protein